MIHIVSGDIWMDDHGRYIATVVDYQSDVTHENLEVPDHFIGALPIILQQLQRHTQ